MMNKSILLGLLIVFATQFQQNDAIFNLIELAERLLFRASSEVYPNVFITGEVAQQKFIQDEEYRKVKPKKLEQQLRELDSDIMRWRHYHDETFFFLRFLVRWIFEYYERRKMILKGKLREAEQAGELEPLCHNRFHRFGEQEALNDCFKAFQHEFIKSKGWLLRDSNGYTCNRITVYKIEDPRGSTGHIANNRKARSCSAKTNDGQTKFTVYLIAGREFVERDRFAYYVLLNEDTRTNTMKSSRFWHVNEERKAQVAAFIEE